MQDDKQSWWGAGDPDGTSWKTGSEERRERVEAYVEWLVTPEAERNPRTKKAFAELLGVSQQTLRNYDRDPYVQREVIRRGRAAAKVDNALEVVRALHHRALNSESDAAANTAAKIYLDWIDRQVTGGDVSVEDMTDEEITEKLVELLNARDK